jgi:ubiquinone/menaquinone biosynthesis C-methylase UbiE
MNWNDEELYGRIRESDLYQAGDLASAFNLFKTTDNHYSYEMLIAGPYHLNGKTILDMPCGSGPLTQMVGHEVGPTGHVIGVDFNDDEIKKARATIKQENIQFLCENAQNLSVSTQSIDVIFCHLGLMLFHPLEPVIKTISRILKPGGFFVANLISGKDHSAVFQDYCKITHDYEQYIPKAHRFSWGDPRVNTTEGLSALFNTGLGFSRAIERTQYIVGHCDTPETMLKLLRAFFQISYLLEENDRIKCERELLNMLEKSEDKSGQVNFEIPFEKITIKKT